ncbi:ribosome biogenesis protein BOP1 homolog [Prunus yedoensis var. nudiflora]|uniref:Ribosome biogenesis protein BOP1 homolog n=1 Tax=Prunus yedoensis var. nudiflora TaxID=2094558 RepID=A0A314Z7R1_PRUYE|nr:ribosome biogenesis protein BOP1 homolog [Prunus yedoensis var. nudiflora]
MFELNIDPESLKPKLPNRSDLKPYPVSCYLEYRGHEDAVTSVSVEASGQRIASGVDDILDSLGQDVLLLNTGRGNEEIQKMTKELLSVEMPVPDDSGKTASSVSWLQDDKLEGIRLRHSKKIIRVYDLVKEGKLVRKLETGLREVSSIAVHPSLCVNCTLIYLGCTVYAGDHIIVGSREGKLCWFNMDLSSKPYKTLKLHQKDINNVCFHRSYPLFATCSDDCTAYVFHGMVYSDLNQNPLIVPLEILQGHSSTNGRGIMDCKFHPRQPWLFTAGADSVVRLYCH